MADLIRTITDNDMHVITSQFISAAESIHIAMCRFDDDHAAQEYLRQAMQSVLIGAQECTKLHGGKKVRLPSSDEQEG